MKNRKIRKKFSIVIALAPYRNAEIIKSLRNLDYLKNEYEIIVVKGTNPSMNRNKGAKKAKGEIVVFLDDDAEVERDFLKKAEDFFSNYDVDVLGGPQLTPKDDKKFARISGYALSSIFGGFSIRNRYKKGKLSLNADEKSITSANLFCKKEVIKKVKFNPELWPGEDPDFINRCKETGFRVAYNPEIFIYHRRRPNLKSFIKQIFSYGKTRPAIRTKSIMSVFFLVPLLFLIYLISFVILNFFIISRKLTGFVVSENFQGQDNLFLFLFWLPLLLYFLISIIISLYIAIKEKDSLALFLPFLFLILHISYGFGMISGLIKRRSKR